MVTYIIEHQQAISAVLEEDHNSWPLMPRSAEFTELEALAEVLKSLPVLTDALSGEKEVCHWVSNSERKRACTLNSYVKNPPVIHFVMESS